MYFYHFPFITNVLSMKLSTTAAENHIYFNALIA